MFLKRWSHNARQAARSTRMAMAMVTTDHEAVADGDTDDDNIFIHEALPTEGSTVRLARFTSPDRGRTLYFEIEYHELRHADYRAVSYMWGPKFPVRALYERKTGKMLFVRQNLYDWIMMWVTSEHFDNSLLFWIDQVSINQCCIQERNHQVGIMGDIYKQASLVHVWLGISPRPTPPISRRRRRTGALMDSVYSSRMEAEEVYHKRIARDPYWKRLWILQELILARDLVFEFDRSSMSYTVFTNVAQNYYGNGDSESMRAMTIIELRQDLPLPTNKMSWLWRLSASSECEDPRDRIFGVHGLIAHGFRSAVDYSKPPVLILCEASAMLVSWRMTAETHHGTDIVRLGRAMGVLHDVAETIENELLDSDPDKFKLGCLLLTAWDRWCYNRENSEHVCTKSPKLEDVVQIVQSALQPWFTEKALNDLAAVAEGSSFT